MNWISIHKYLPPKKHKWLIVRCINRDICIFYFMANYIHEHQGWEFFDEGSENEPYDKMMQITHWMVPYEVMEPDVFNLTE